MIADGLLFFSNVATGDTITATQDLSNILDFGAAMDNGITERPLQVFVDWTTAPVGSTPSTTTVQASLSSAPASTGPWTVVTTGGAKIASQIGIGTKWVLDMSPGMQRFAKMTLTVASGTLTAGVVQSGLVLDSDGGQKYYPRAYTA